MAVRLASNYFFSGELTAERMYHQRHCQQNRLHSTLFKINDNNSNKEKEIATSPSFASIFKKKKMMSDLIKVSLSLLTKKKEREKWRDPFRSLANPLPFLTGHPHSPSPPGRHPLLATYDEGCGEEGLKGGGGGRETASTKGRVVN